MIIDVDCPRCGGLGELQCYAVNRRSARVDYDDLDPDDFAKPCDKCGGSGVVAYDPEDEIDEWMRDA
jgi:RecJ-like exonuclease